MANEHNITNYNNRRSTEEARENGKKGGFASGESRKAKKKYKDNIEYILELEAKELERKLSTTGKKEKLKLLKEAGYLAFNKLFIYKKILELAEETTEARDKTIILAKANDLLEQILDRMEGKTISSEKIENKFRSFDIEVTEEMERQNKESEERQKKFNISQLICG